MRGHDWNVLHDIAEVAVFVLDEVVTELEKLIDRFIRGVAVHGSHGKPECHSVAQVFDSLHVMADLNRD